jgi:hypothetical protein
MSSSPDNFESLEKLLRLKRHEQPPPRYFNEFSGRVMARLERGEGRSSWWERFGFDLRPALAAGVGMVACGLIVYGVATTDGEAEAIGMTGSMGFNGNEALAPKPLLANAEQSMTANSTNPVSPFGTPIDRNVFQAKIVPAGFEVPSNH